MDGNKKAVLLMTASGKKNSIKRGRAKIVLGAM
jgi:hypothetical protein